MNKEEIIIDGVNVKDCKRRIGKNNYCRYFKRPCADNNFNCIWKQHKRLKEENVYYKNLAKDAEQLTKLSHQEFSAFIEKQKLEIQNLQEELTALQQTYEACEKEYRALTKRYHELQAKCNATYNMRKEL